MFEMFSDRARKTLALANQEAQRLNHEYISSEHILLGLLKEGTGVGANVLKNFDVDLKKARNEVEKIAPHGPATVAIGKLPQTPVAKKVIEHAIEEARNLNHKYVGTEHLLLGLLRDRDGVAAQVLVNLGVKGDEVREEVVSLLSAGTRDDTATQPTPAARSDNLIGSGLELQRLLFEIEEECQRLLICKDEAVKGANYERAVEFRDRAEGARRASEGLRDALAQIKTKAEQIRDELRRE